MAREDLARLLRSGVIPHMRGSENKKVRNARARP